MASLRGGSNTVTSHAHCTVVAPHAITADSLATHAISTSPVPRSNKPGFETPETLNMENCYHCLADTEVCPSSDGADRFLQFTSPLDYESLLEVGTKKYVLPSTTSGAALEAQYAPAYAAWRARAGAAPHPYTERDAPAAEAASREANAAAMAKGVDIHRPFQSA